MLVSGVAASIHQSMPWHNSHNLCPGERSLCPHWGKGESSTTQQGIVGEKGNGEWGGLWDSTHQWDTQQTEGGRCRALGPHPSPFINPSKRKPTHSQTARKSVCLGQSEQQEKEDEAVEQETGHGSTAEHTGPVGDHEVE